MDSRQPIRIVIELYPEHVAAIIAVVTSVMVPVITRLLITGL